MPAIRGPELGPVLLPVNKMGRRVSRLTDQALYNIVNRRRTEAQLGPDLAVRLPAHVYRRPARSRR